MIGKQFVARLSSSYRFVRFVRYHLASKNRTKHAIDLKYGVETSSLVEPWGIRTGHCLIDAQNIGYAGSQPSIIHAVLATIPNKASSSFVDLGCGKGRVLVIASEYEFAEIA